MREVNVTLKQEKPDSPKSRLDRWQQIAQITSLLALPLIVAIGGWVLQSAGTRHQTSQRYVELAIGILREKPDPDSEGLRRWAVGTISKFSAEPFTSDELRKLQSGTLTLLDRRIARLTLPTGDAVVITCDFGSGVGHFHLSPKVGGGVGTDFTFEPIK